MQPPGIKQGRVLSIFIYSIFSLYKWIGDVSSSNAGLNVEVFFFQIYSNQSYCISLLFHPFLLTRIRTGLIFPSYLFKMIGNYLIFWISVKVDFKKWYSYLKTINGGSLTPFDNIPRPTVKCCLFKEWLIIVTSLSP